jgi:hypothetical protein
MTKSIPLTKGAVALLDDSDYDWLMAQGRWSLVALQQRVRPALANAQWAAQSPPDAPPDSDGSLRAAS